MAKNKRKNNTRKKKQEDPDFDISEFVQPETMRGVGGIFLIAIAVFLVLAAFGIGGFVGETLYRLLGSLLGVGYALLPISVAIAAVMLLRSHEERISALKWASSFVFFTAALGVVEIILPTRGGIVGSLITTPLIAAIDTPATVIFLLAFIVAALLVSFDLHPGTIIASIKERIGRDEEDEEEDIAIDIPTDATEESTETNTTDDEEDAGGEEEEEEPKKQGFLSRFTDSEADDLPPIMAATGVAYEPPPISLLGKNKGKPEVGDVKANANIIKRTLQNFGILVEMDEVSIGPTVTRYAMKPAEGVRLSKILTLQSNLELALAASPVRIEAPIPGKSLVGIEVPNQSRTTLGLAPLLSDTSFTQSDKPLLVALGRSITGIPHYADLSRMPHMLIAGATGAGKSVTVHDIIVSLLYRCGPEQLRLVMVDPKRVELTLYNSIPHLLTPVITDAKKAILALKWLAKEMDRRYDVLETERVRDIVSYHTNVLKPALEAATQGSEGDLPEPMPYIVVIMDELADIMQAYPRELESGIVRLAQMSRAVGIHLILSTQRPSVKVITGLIKANVPARLALQVASQIDSRTILDMGGAEKLLGAGDMLFLSGEMSKPIRVQAPYVSESEVKKVTKYLADTYEGILPSEIDFSGGIDQNGGGTDPIFSAMLDDGGEEEDDLYQEARQAVIEAGRASTSYLQRKLRIGYARAARLMDILEENGVIGPADGARPRDVLVGQAGGADDADDSDDTDDAEEEDR